MPKTNISAHNLPTGYQTILSGEKHGYLADEPETEGGTDLGFQPNELLLSSLAACKAMTIRFYARKKEWNLEEVKVHCEMNSEREGGKVSTKISANIELRGDLDDAQKSQLLAVAAKCPIHRLLLGEIEIN